MIFVIKEANFFAVVAGDMSINKPSWGLFIGFGVEPVTVFLGLRISIITTSNFGDIPPRGFCPMYESSSDTSSGSVGLYYFFWGFHNFCGHQNEWDDRDLCMASVPFHMVWTVMRQTCCRVVPVGVNKQFKVVRIIGLILGAGQKIMMANIVAVMM